MAQDSQEKTLPATEHRLRKEREKGRVASSQDFVSAGVALAGAIWLVARGPAVAGAIADAFRLALDTVARASDPLTGARAVQATFSGLAMELAGLVAFLALAGMAVNAAHKGGPAVSTKPLAPDFSRIALGAGVQRLFNMRHMSGLGVSLLWLLAWFAATAIIVWSYAPAMLNGPLCGFGCIVATGTDMLQVIATVGLVVIVIAGLLDLPLQIFLFRREMRMSHQEMKQETKDTQGSPEVQQERRRLHQQLQQLGSSAPTMVIASSDCAVALRFHARDLPVPMVTAKGRGATRERVIAAAARLGIPVALDPVLAQRLMETVQVGSEIPSSEFGAVAPHIVRSTTSGMAA